MNNEQLIAEHCVGIEERIRQAANRTEARRVADNACAQLGRQCDSETVAIFLKHHVESLFKKHWGESR